jgi:hypothetical protein
VKRLLREQRQERDRLKASGAAMLRAAAGTMRFWAVGPYTIRCKLVAHGKFRTNIGAG